MNDIDIKELKNASNVLRAITHPLRIQILDFISKNEPVNVSVIYKKLDLEQSVTSSHLSILRKDEFLLTSREGKKIYYSVNSKRIEGVLKSIKSYFIT
jgi:ArsR family transcriptional regulator